jgi:hypothetical protein
MNRLMKGLWPFKVSILRLINLLNGGRLYNTGERGKELRTRADQLRFLS